MIWLLVGGDMSAQIRKVCNEQGVAYKITLITEYGKDSGLSYSSKALTPMMTELEAIQFINKHQIKYVVDDTYRQWDKTRKAIVAACKACEVPYVRCDTQDAIFKEEMPLNQIFDKVAELNGNIGLSMSRKYIKLFCQHFDVMRFYIEVNKSERIMRQYQEIGIKPEQIIQDFEDFLESSREKIDMMIYDKQHFLAAHDKQKLVPYVIIGSESLDKHKTITSIDEFKKLIMKWTNA